MEQLNVYNLENHGDSIEKKYHEFITKQFSNYEKVWSLYIGNTGKNTKASINNYPSEKEEDRQKFSEHTYTVLLSVINLHRILESQSTFSGILDIDNNLLLFFSHVGRIIDNLENASKIIGLDFSRYSELRSYIEKRNIVIHGTKIPILLHGNGLIEIPIISGVESNPKEWHDKKNKWEDIRILDKDNIESTFSCFFYEFIPKVDGLFGCLYKNIKSELEQSDCKIYFEYSTIESFETGGKSDSSVSFSTSGSSNTSGSFGSSGYGSPN